MAAGRVFPGLFGNGANRSAPGALSPGSERGILVNPGEMALDAIASILRTLGEFGLDQEKMDAATFAGIAERWAQHVLVATPPPGGAAGEGPSPEARRDWTGIKDFVRSYLKSSTGHARDVMVDLRQMVWVFIQNLNHSFAQDVESDQRIKDQLLRLEKLAHGPTATSDLKREVVSTVVAVAQMMEARRTRQRQQMEHLGEQVQTLGSELETVRRESETDPLTKLFNRKAFDEYLNRSVDLYRAFGQETCLLLVDVDHFKTINDTFGHTTGDTVLCKMSDAVSRVFLRKNDFVARYGGDEIAIILRETTLKDGLMLAERMLKGVRALHIEREGVTIKVTSSVGIAALTEAQDGKAWLDSADAALYRAKLAGRDRAAAAEPAGPLSPHLLLPVD